MTAGGRPPGGQALLVAFGALLALAAASFALSYAHLGRFVTPVALAVAFAKAAIVLAVFMELSRESASIRLAVAAAGLLVALLIAFVVGDVATRDAIGVTPPSPEPLGARVPVGPSRRLTEGPAKTSAGPGEGAMRP